MRFLIDEQLPTALVGRLVEIGHLAEHVAGIGLRGAPDRDVWASCHLRRAVLITKDEDFTVLARGPGAGSQVVWIRIGNTTARELWAALEPVWPEVVAALRAGERLIEVG